MSTLKEIARQTDLRVSTVSDILNERPGARYAAATVKRVRAKAAELKYRPNRLARSLRSGRTMTVGMVVPDLLDPFYAMLVSRVAGELRRAGYDTLIEEAPISSSAESEDHALRRLRDMKVDGLIASLIHGGELQELLGEMASGGGAMYVFGMKSVSGLAVDTCTLEYGAAIPALAGHLCGLGHRRFLFAGVFPWDQRRGRRYHLLAESLRAHGIKGQPEVSMACEHNPKGAMRAFREYLGNLEGPPPTTVVALNDQIAIGVMRAALDAGLKVPGDLSVVGFGATDIAYLLPIRLTTIATPIEEMASAAARAVLRRMGSDGELPAQVEQFQAVLKIGESTGPENHG